MKVGINELKISYSCILNNAIIDYNFDTLDEFIDYMHTNHPDIKLEEVILKWNKLYDLTHSGSNKKIKHSYTLYSYTLYCGFFNDNFFISSHYLGIREKLLTLLNAYQLATKDFICEIRCCNWTYDSDINNRQTVINYWSKVNDKDNDCRILCYNDRIMLYGRANNCPSIIVGKYTLNYKGVK